MGNATNVTKSTGVLYNTDRLALIFISGLLHCYLSYRFLNAGDQNPSDVLPVLTLHGTSEL